MVFREKTLQKHCVLQAILAAVRRRVVHMVATAIEEIRTPSASAVGEKLKIGRNPVKMCYKHV